MDRRAYVRFMQFGLWNFHNDEAERICQKLGRYWIGEGGRHLETVPAPNKQPLSDSFVSKFRIRQILQCPHPPININYATPPMFYFVFPNSLALPSYSWMLPQPHTSENQESTQKQELLSECRKSVVSNIILSPLPCDSPSCTESDSKGSNSKNYLIFKKIEADDEYKPLGGHSKRNKKSKQMENRNVVPNIIRLILSHIQKKEKSLRLVEALLKRYNSTPSSSMTANRYYLFQKLVRGKMNNYVNEDTLKELYRMRPEDYEIFSEQEQRLYNRITRTIIADFLQEDILLCVLTSKRMESAKKRTHMQAVRTIKDKMRALLQC